ncbi:sodium-translocating pyrophosphatase [Aeromicrobium sp. CF4.19]|uniref:sodium-translocating pyrophosphatase n=1 Tax=Aeromicrobium sp. CF4.19 TaxID=3373082 RepID=UPI003EE59FB9
MSDATLVAAAAAEDLGLSTANTTYVALVAGVGVLALVFAVLFRSQVLAADEGTAKMQEIGLAVQEGASAYLTRQFKTLAVFVVLAFGLLFLLPGDLDIKIGRSVAFLFGALFSALIGYFGMWLAVRANVRVAAAAQNEGRESAMRIAFRTGGTVGMSTVGLGLLGAAAVVLIYKGEAPTVLEGFGFGAALLAMFMRVGGGIFTKAADVGADLVGKVENNIPEDDPRNAATIADNVGDNVGDCAGMAADLFESYAVTLVAALILGSVAFGEQGLVFPLVIPAIGAITAIFGVFLTRGKVGESGLTTINRSFYITAFVGAVASSLFAWFYLPSSFSALEGVGGEPETQEDALLVQFFQTENLAEFDGDPRLIAMIAVLIGIVLAAVILALTGYFTGTETRPVKDVGKTSLTGPATVILSGLSVGFESAVYTALVIGAAVYGAFLLGGGSITIALFAVALAGCGLLTTVGVIVAMDTFGPVSDNAQGIAEMSGDIDAESAQILTELDAVGNTTKAITKGIAIATAVLAATALFGAFANSIRDAFSPIATAAFTDPAAAEELGEQVDTTAAAEVLRGVINITDPANLLGLLIGVSVVFLFTGLAISAVGRAAGAVVYEVRRQFREIPGIMEGTGRPEYGKVVDICTRDSLRELATPGILAIFAPIAVGFGLGIGPLGAYLAGAIGAGTLMAVFLANSGGAWDNAKKLVEDGNHGGKGSLAHEATIIGDTVGDPFKDTAGPAINPLLKVMNLVALLAVPLIVQYSYGADDSPWVRYSIAGVSAAIIVVAVYISKRRPIAIGDAQEPGAVDPTLHDPEPTPSA